MVRGGGSFTEVMLFVIFFHQRNALIYISNKNKKISKISI